MQIVDDATYTTASYNEAYDYDSQGRVEGVTSDLGAFDYAFEGGDLPPKKWTPRYAARAS